jgi:hypothetical protein
MDNDGSAIPQTGTGAKRGTFAARAESIFFNENIGLQRRAGAKERLYPRINFALYGDAAQRQATHIREWVAP